MARQDLPPGLKSAQQAESRRRRQQSQRDRRNSQQKQLNQATQQVSNSTKQSKAPQIKQTYGTGVTISHDEQVAVIPATTTDFVVQFQGYINPGQVQMFPWLSGVATRYEKFRFTKFQVKYRAQSASTTAGYVSMYVDYDSTDPVATTDQLASNNVGATVIQPWNNGQMNGNPFQQKYIMVGNQPANTDIHTFSPGSLYIASGANPSSGTRLGVVWVSYTVQLSKPQIELPIAQYVHLNATCSSGKPFGVINSNQGFQPLIVQPDGNTFTLSGIGEYLINILWNTSSQASTFALNQQDPYGATTSVINSFRNIITSTNLQQMFKVTLKGLTNFTFASGGFGGPLTGIDMRVTNDKGSYDPIQS